jgi:YVTN family beta-propeller protein
MRVMSKTVRPLRHGIAISLLGALVLGTGFITAGPAAAKAQKHYDFNAPTSAAVVGADLFVTNGLANSVTELKTVDGSYVARIHTKRFKFNHPTAITAVGPDLFVANGAGNSVTEIAAAGRKRVRIISGPSYQFSDPIAFALSGTNLFVLNGTGSLTEIATGTGALVGTVSGPAFGFHQPTGIAVGGGKVFVANRAANTVTVVNAATRGLVAILSGASYSFNAPTGVAFDGSNIWVTNQNADSVTELSASTLAALNVVVDTTNLPSVGPIIFGDEYIFTLSPPGSSPMVSQVTVSSPPSIPWMMCNTNGPYNFNNPQAAVANGTNLWIVNEGGNSLTEMDTDSGALIRTVSN